MKLELLLAAGLFGLLALAAALLGTWPVNLLAVVLGAMAVLCLCEFLLLWQRSRTDRWRGLMAVALVLCAVLLSLGPALAAGTEIPLGPVFGDVRPTLEVGLAGAASLVVAWIAYLAQRYLRVSIDETRRNALQDALVNGVHYGLDRLQSRADAKAVDVRSQVVADAISYVQTFSGHSVDHFGLSSSDLGVLLQPWLARLLPPADAAGQPSATT